MYHALLLYELVFASVISVFMCTSSGDHQLQSIDIQSS